MGEGWTQVSEGWTQLGWAQTTASPLRVAFFLQLGSRKAVMA